MAAFLVPVLPHRKTGASSKWRPRSTCLCSAKKPSAPAGKRVRQESHSPHVAAAAAFAAASLSLASPAAHLHFAAASAVSQPDVFPAALERATPGSPIADLAEVFASRQEERLGTRLADFEERSGVRVRILTQSFGSAPGSAIKEFFGLDENSVLIVLDRRGGNVLNFNIGSAVSPKLPESFWIELGNRYGNRFYVRDNGEDRAVLTAVDDIMKCIDSGKICRAVPGFGRDQYAVSLVCSGVGGAVAGAAARTGGQKLNFAWLLLFAPLWGIFFASFGLLPVVTREGWANGDVAGVFGAFTVAASFTWAWIPIRFGSGGTEKTKPDI